MPAAPPACGISARSYVFEPKAYAKAVMHCFKHSSDACIGVFVGSASAEALKIVDAIPLFHTHALAPMLKVAFMLVDEHCRTVGDLEIVGIYHATAHGGTEITPVKNVADKVASNFIGASVWTLDALKLSMRQEFPFIGMYHSKDEWKLINTNSVTLNKEALKQTAGLITDMRHLDVVDFDDHLASPAANWLNPNLL
mmetsp:Transcript_24033/g.66838  ORF Transcript_24033/g.66838 Transcript_24033/m.66838 type:complete len:197 (+) Transcript_24033:116-706(+)